MAHFRSITPMFLLLLAAVPLDAQPSGGWPGRPRYADGLFRITFFSGASKYFGEFTDEQIGPMGGMTLHYAMLPYLEFGVGGEVGHILFTRRHRRNMGGTYEFQFGNANLVDRGTEVMTGEAWLRLNLFPAQWFNAWVLAGAGVTMFRPEDYRNGDASHPGAESIHALCIPLGAGFEWFLARRWSVQLGVVAHLVMSGELDAFDSGHLVELQQRSLGLPSNPAREKTANDTYLTASLGISYSLFTDDDIDGDALSNDDEASVRTNPYDADTDGDGLTDFEEVRLYLTDPLLRDTDGDVLSDYVEVTRYRTDPLKADTDDDGLSDREELLDYQTDPLARDTENDGLIDAEEKRLGSNPKKVDTDGDGLYDGDEVVLYHTNPVLPDSDGEGISDHDEVIIYRTDPNAADTDQDGLTDYEEIRLFRTDPLSPDTDGDGVTDYDELRRFGTDPRSASSGDRSASPSRGF
ncbi:MAG: hypothetical protein JXA28_09435 [Bacteroidetes bacterium]|nr:hypothetical protein [Bacteroidota bacterium]